MGQGKQGVHRNPRDRVDAELAVLIGIGPKP